MNVPEFASLSGVARVDALNDSAWQLRVTDSVASHTQSREAVELSRSLGYPRGLAEGLRTLGFTHIRLAKHSEALEALEEAASLFSELQDSEGLADIYEYRGIIERSRSNYAASVNFLLRSLQIRADSENAEGIALSLYHTGVTYRYAGDYGRALDYLLQSLEIARKSGCPMPESYALKIIGDIHFELGDFEASLDHYQESLSIRSQIGDAWGEAGCLDNIGRVYAQLGRFADAKEYCLLALGIAEEVGDQKGRSNALYNLSGIALREGRYAEAIDRAQESLAVREAVGDKKGQGEVLRLLGEVYADSAFPEWSIERALEYLFQALELDRSAGASDLAYSVHLALAHVLKAAGRYEEALEHFEAYHATEKEVNSELVSRRILSLRMEHEVQNAQKEAELFRLRNVELAELVEKISAQREEIEAKNSELEATLKHLRSAQAQLIQQEKLASLGALTAGIAHEIKNPLNFVNNFASLAAELLDEVEVVRKNEPRRPVSDFDEDLSIVRLNVGKIEAHGKRADGIVRSMLEHSRGEKGERVPTDVNALVDEYANLAFHGMRAQLTGFECTIDRNYDEATGAVELVPQEIGRVLLNLLSNAFYAVHQKRLQKPDGYSPIVRVIVQRRANLVEIRIEDNGPGIPDDVREKIFEPFFTTKPTGEGTGLGLSLAYDIITQGHGGTLFADRSGEGGAAFVIELLAQEEPAGSRLARSSMTSEAQP